MFHKGTNWLSYLKSGCLLLDEIWAAPPWQTRLTHLWSGKGQLREPSTLGWLKHVCRDKPLHPTHALLCHSWPNDLSLQKLRFDMTKPKGPLASSVILPKTLEIGEAAVCLLCLGKWRQMVSHKFLPTPESPNPAWGLQAASQRWHRCHLSTLLLLATTPGLSQVC